MKIVTVIGARPQFVKAALISNEFKKRGITEIIIHTGQHYDPNMSDVFFNQLNIPEPAYNLGIKANSHGEMTGRMLIEIERVLQIENPDLLLVYGDTNSTLAAALAARKLNIKIAHVEAGLRNFDMTIPEDVNRILTDRVSDILFCPTQEAINNLIAEGFEKFPAKLVKTDDLLADMVYYYDEKLDEFSEETSAVSKLVSSLQKPILCTIHRAESTTNTRIVEIIKALNTIAQQYDIIFPIHPRTKNVIEKLGLILHENIQLLAPLSYVEMIYALKHCRYVITDSGGLQKEAYLMKKYCLILMNYTPWVELINHKVSVTTQLTTDDILSNFKKMETLETPFNQSLYGEGSARFQIVDYLQNYFNHA